MLGERITNKIHELINENGEQLIFSLHCDTSFDGWFYIELRYSLSGGKGILYQFYEGPHYHEGSFHMSMIEYLHALRNHRQHFSGTDEAMEYFNYRPFIIKTQIDEIDHKEILTLLKENSLPDAQGEAFGLDGHNIVFRSYVDCASTYSYWVYPPKGYDYLRVVTNIISKHLKAPYGELVYIKQNISNS